MEPRDLLHEEGGEGRYRIDADLHFEDHHVKQILCYELCHGEFCGSCFPDDEPCGCMIIEKEELSSLRSRLEKAEKELAESERVKELRGKRLEEERKNWWECGPCEIKNKGHRRCKVCNGMPPPAPYPKGPRQFA